MRHHAMTACLGASLLLAGSAAAQDMSAKSYFDAADADRNGTLSRQEFRAEIDRLYRDADRDGDGRVLFEDVAGMDRGKFDTMDANHDGWVSGAELRSAKDQAFASADRNGDGMLSYDELK